MRTALMLVLHQGKYVSVIQRTLGYYHHVCVLMLFHVLVCSL